MKKEKITCPEPEREVEYKFVKTAKLRPNCVIIQNRFIGTQRTQTNLNSLGNLEKGTSGQYNGYLSPATTRKLRSIIENFLTAVQLNTSMKFPKSFPSIEVYPTFLTLTLPSKQWHCDKDLKDIFSRFMEYLTGSKEKGFSGWGVKNYIWTSETQKNGNLHFHVILDRALPAKRINEIWNKHIERLGYVTRYRTAQGYIYRNGFFVRGDMLKMAIKKYRDFCRKSGKPFRINEAVATESERQRKAYDRGLSENWKNPPTTKIHAIQNIIKLTAYVSKYMTKAPTIVQPSLAEGESLVQENGKFFVVSQKENKTFDMITGDELSCGGEVTKTEITVRFENRHMKGRIWGASKLLHTEEITPFMVNILAYDRINTVSYQLHESKYKTAKYVTDMFGERVYVGMQEIKEQKLQKIEKSDFEQVPHNTAGARWVEWLEKEHVPERDIKRATNAAGQQFRDNGGVIIPLEFQQKDLLKSYSPDLYEEYCQHYTGIFRYLYA